MTMLRVQGAVDLEVGGASSRLDGLGDGIVIESSSPMTFVGAVFAAGRSAAPLGQRIGVRQARRALDALPPISLVGPSGPVLRTRPGRRVPLVVRRPLPIIGGWLRSRRR